MLVSDGSEAAMSSLVYSRQFTSVDTKQWISNSALISDECLLFMADVCLNQGFRDWVPIYCQMPILKASTVKTMETDSGIEHWHLVILNPEIPGLNKRPP